MMRAIRSAIVLAAALATAAGPALAAGSSAPLWSALGGQVVCGIAIHPPNTPPMQLLCSSPVVPRAKTGTGDGGNVFLGSDGHPTLALLSQDSFVASDEVKLKSKTTWSIGPIALHCRVSETKVRCENRDHHGFTITRRSYHPF